MRRLRLGGEAGLGLALVAVGAGFLGGAGVADAGFPGKNGMIVFAAQGPHSKGPWAGPFDLWTVRPTGAGLINLTQSPEDESQGASFSPDGKSLAFTREGEIWVMRPDGSGQTKLASGGKHPTWAPDGKRLAFEGAGRVEVMNADGTGRRTLREGVGDPSWSPKGYELAVTHDYWVAVMSADGKKLKNLAKGGAPTWSPDGKRIAFVGNPRSACVGSVVFLIGRDGRGLVDIARACDVTAPGLGEVAWAPDGSRLAYIAELAGILLMKPDGTGRTGVARNSGFGSLDWRPLPVRR